MKPPDAGETVKPLEGEEMQYANWWNVFSPPSGRSVLYYALWGRETSKLVELPNDDTFAHPPRALDPSDRL